MGQNKYKRSRFIINPQFQYRLIALFFAVSLVMSGAILAFAWKSYSSFTSKLQEKQTQMGLYTEMVNEYVEKDVTVFWVPKEFKREFLWKLLGFTLLLSLAVIFLGVFVSHRIAGPLHRLNRFMLDIAEGKAVPELRFRDHDEFMHMAESFNKCVHALASKPTGSAGSTEAEQEKSAAFIEIRDHLRQVKDETIRLGILEILERYSEAKPEEPLSKN